MKMKNKAFDIRAYPFTESDCILPDSNFWLNTFGPTSSASNRSRNAVYADALARMIAAKSVLVFEVLVFSEIVNVWAREEFNVNYRGVYGTRGFKRFRNSPDFLQVASVIATECRKIERLCIRRDHPFSEWDFKQIVDDYSTGGKDVNDQLLVEVAKKHGDALLTDDGDLTEGGITLLTANPRLLQACPSN